MKLKLDLNQYETCPPFNEWLDRQHVEQVGELSIFGYKPRPSQVLFTLSQDTYQALFGDFQQERIDELRETVCDEFPSPIAHYFYRFENGYESNLQRLHLLRDTWEAVVDVLHAVAVAECRFRRLSLSEPLTCHHLLSDSVAKRIENIKLILAQAGDVGVTLGVSSIVTPAVLETMRELNQSRNAFSHSAAQSEAQANNWIVECLEDVFDVLDDLRGLADLQLLRYTGQKDGTTLRCEVFRGHSGTKTISDIPISPGQASKSRRYFAQDQILTVCDGHIFGLRPFVYYRIDPSGHVTKLCMYRKARGDAPTRWLEYEVVGDAVRHEEDRTLFKPELDELRALFGLKPD